MIDQRTRTNLGSKKSQEQKSNNVLKLKELEKCKFVYVRMLELFDVELLGLPWEGGPQGGGSSDWGGGTKGTTNWLGTAFKPMGARARLW